MKHEATNLLIKKAFAQAFKDAAEHKPLAKITVSELVQACGVNRKTFYYHFEDIYALLKWTLEQEAIEVVKKFDLRTQYEDAVIFVMDYVEQNESFLKNICSAVGRDELKRFFYLDFTEIIRTVISEVEGQMGFSVEKGYRDFLGQFYTEAMAGILLDWITNGGNREQLLKYFSAVIRSGIPAALGQWKCGEEKAHTDTAMD